jgi:uncharacterized SAM-binding protein YcdF (DUF218 family)
VKYIVAFFLLPLGLTLVLLAILAWLAWRRRHLGGLHGGVGAGLIAAPFALLFIMAMPLVGQGLQNGLAGLVKGRLVVGEPIDAIVVLTGGIYDAGPVGWMPRAETIQRVGVAYELQRTIDIRLPVIISGGFTHGVQAPSEARAAAEFFAKHRSEVTPTELEEVSTDTAESALQLAPVLQKRGARNVMLVTSVTHMPRALAAFRARGIDPIPAPAFNITHNKGVALFAPSARGLWQSSEALLEIYGIIGYLLSGTIAWADLTYPQKS